MDEEQIFQLAELLADEVFGQDGMIKYSERQELSLKFHKILSEKLCNDRANFFKFGHSAINREERRDDIERIRTTLINRGFTSCKSSDAEGLWATYSDEHWSAGFVSIPDDEETIYKCIKYQLVVCDN